MAEPKVIVISDQRPGLPYSKGLRASELMVTGLSPFRAYQVAEQVEVRLRERQATSVTSDELDELTMASASRRPRCPWGSTPSSSGPPWRAPA